MIRYTHIRKAKQELNAKLNKKYLKIKRLRIKLFSKQLKIKQLNNLSTTPLDFKSNKQKVWLENAYNKNSFNINKFDSAKNKQDFLQTLVGQYLILAHLSSTKIGARRWLSYSENFFQIMPTFFSTVSDTAKEIQLNHKLGWYYTNLTRIKKVRKDIFLKTKKIYPYKLFSTYWRAYKKAPWLSFLQSKRSIYSGLLERQRREQKWLRKYVWVPYLRKKKPHYQKQQQLYRWRNNFLFSRFLRGRLLKKNFARIKNVVSKNILPFYGHITQKQFTAIKNKTQRKKPQNSLARDELLLNHFERRLDVVVFRLNLAPTIFWARQLIKNGAIFVTSTYNPSWWEKVYAPLKKFAYPLKLRDPMHLYDKTIWKPFKKLAKLKFLLEPLIKIDYLVQPGEIIQCAPGALLNKFKTNRILWKKPVPKHFLHFSDITETNKSWQYQQNKISSFATSENNHTIIATLISYPSYNNLLKSDRVNREFIRWISL